MPEEFKRCANCGERIELINFAMGPEWRHWPTLYGNYNTRDKYRFCQTRDVATPKADAEIRQTEPNRLEMKENS